MRLSYYCLSALLLAGALPSLHAEVLYSVTALGSLSDYEVTFGVALNNQGQVAGTSETSSSAYHAFLYTDGQMQDLGTLGGYGSLGSSLNDRGQVVGGSSTSSRGVHAFLYTDGQMQDLNALIDPSLGITLNYAKAINDHGQIVTYSVSGSGFEIRSYLLTPVPEPGTWALLSVALLGGGAWAWGRARGKNTSVEP